MSTDQMLCCTSRFENYEGVQSSCFYLCDNYYWIEKWRNYHELIHDNCKLWLFLETKKEEIITNELIKEIKSKFTDKNLEGGNLNQLIFWLKGHLGEKVELEAW